LITIDKDGVWFYQGNEIFRRDIVRLFYDHLKRDSSGTYVIELDNDRSEVTVEDAPYVVTAVDKQDTSIEIVLNDSRRETLDPATLRMGKDNVPYCTVREGTLDARFSRAAYYQMAAFIEYESDADAFYLSVNNNNYYIDEHKPGGE